MRTGARAPQKWGRPQVGTGVGKAWKMGNLFAEPQWTVLHQGEGQPKFQVFMGLNLQLSL